MRILKLSKITDFIFFAGLMFLICFLWLRYFLHDFWLAVILSATITFVTMSIYHIFYKNKENKQNISHEEIKKANQITTKFLLSTKTEILKTFFEKLEKKYNTKIKSDYLLVNDNVLRPIYTTQTITDKDILESYTKIKDTSAKKLIITCQNTDESSRLCAKLITDKEIVILTEFEAYETIFKPLEFEVPDINTLQKTKKNFSYYLSFALNKSRTKSYLIVAVFMLFASFVLRYNIYYLIFSSITGLLALYSHFNTRFNKKQQNLM